MSVFSPLYEAIKHDDIDHLKAVISDYSINTVSITEIVKWMVSFNRVEMLRILIDSKVACQVAIDFAIGVAIEQPNRECAELLLSRLDPKTLQETDAFYWAANSGQHDLVVNFLRAGYAHRDGLVDGFAAAALGNHQAICQQLLDEGLTLQENELQEILCEAIIDRDLCVASALLERFSPSDNILHYAAEDAASGRRVDCLILLLQAMRERPADPWYTDIASMRSPLSSINWRAAVESTLVKALIHVGHWPIAELASDCTTPARLKHLLASVSNVMDVLPHLPAGSRKKALDFAIHSGNSPEASLG